SRSAPRATTAANRRLGAEEQALRTAQDAWERIFRHNDAAHVPAEWVAGFYGLYALAQKTFGVNWLLLASIHRQETAFSTAGSTYHGLNWVHCCAGPMQFNVTNGVISTWDKYKLAYRLASRPAGYPHETEHHPSVYDDFDAIMAAASMLRSDGAGAGLDQAAWNAAYLYYGGSLEGVDYANEVLARAIGWSQHGFSANTPVDRSLVESVHAAWGEPVRRELVKEQREADEAAGHEPATTAPVAR
ncbi:MAG TPA: hypothetical protein VHB30_05900, partial [Solirubrobacteraceae bacterium]|nr:hypothetical protein [Solirubrobacteraceae bacterium]